MELQKRAPQKNLKMLYKTKSRSFSRTTRTGQGAVRTTPLGGAPKQKMLKSRVPVSCNHNKLHLFGFRDFNNLFVRRTLTDLRAKSRLRADIRRIPAIQKREARGLKPE